VAVNRRSPQGWLPPEQGLWRDPRPGYVSRYALIVFLVCATAFAGLGLTMGLMARTSGPTIPVASAAGPAVMLAPGCAAASNAVPFIAMPSPGRTDSFTVDGRPVHAYLPVSRPAPGLPVVYFLHGSSGTASDWDDGGAHLPAMIDRMVATGQLPPLIAILPDGYRGNPAPGTWWGNTADGAALESWFVSRLVPAVDARYPTLGPARRGIAGVSAGGFGALNLALRHPGTFAWVASYSGVFQAPAELFGSATAANSPALTAGALPTARRFPLYVGAGSDDWEFRSESTAFTALVRALHWTPLLTETVPGPHDWGAWTVEIRDSLAWLGRLWGGAPVATAAQPAPAPHPCR
jgi:enterochelin esterase-like enzyme